MKRLMIFALALALIPLVGAQPIARVDRATLMFAFDLDGEAADADQVVTVANGVLTDSTAYTLTADPDSCRLLDITVVDTNLNSGTLTVTGTGCLDEARVCTFAFTAGDDTGVQTLTCTDGQGAYFKTVTDASTGVMVGESDETFTLGYTSNSVNGWAVAGKLTNIGTSRGVDVHGLYEVAKKITTAGAASTTLDGVVGADDPFALVSVGDILVLNISGFMYERAVMTRASADQITIDQAVTIPAAGVTFKYKKLFFSTNPLHDMSFSVNGYRSINLVWSVDANANTGGVVTSFQCTYEAATLPTATWVVIDTTTVGSGGTQAPTSEPIDLVATPYNRCRFGLKFGTGDDGDVAAEDINAGFTLVQ